MALLGRTLAFYDARRLGELDAKAEGSGITDVWVYRMDGSGNMVLDENANMYFDFHTYYPIPDVEAVFNIDDSATPQM